MYERSPRKRSCLHTCDAHWGGFVCWGACQVLQSVPEPYLAHSKWYLKDSAGVPARCCKAYQSHTRLIAVRFCKYPVRARRTCCRWSRRCGCRTARRAGAAAAARASSCWRARGTTAACAGSCSAAPARAPARCCRRASRPPRPRASAPPAPRCWTRCRPSWLVRAPAKMC